MAVVDVVVVGAGVMGAATARALARDGRRVLLLEQFPVGHARDEVLSIAYAGQGQHQDAGGKFIHAAPNTSSAITSKSISIRPEAPRSRRPKRGLTGLPVHGAPTPC